MLGGNHGFFVFIGDVLSHHDVLSHCDVLSHPKMAYTDLFLKSVPVFIIPVVQFVRI